MNCGKGIIGRAEFVEAVGSDEMLEAGYGEFVEEFYVDCTAFKIGSNNLGGSSDWGIGIEEEALNRDVAAAIELENVIVI